MKIVHHRSHIEIEYKYLRRKQVPMLYDGDMHQHDRVLTWLTSQDVFEIKNEIEEVNRKMLDKLLEENEFLAVYFCTFIVNAIFIYDSSKMYFK